MRERLFHASTRFLTFRITPARAGKTNLLKSNGEWYQDHPRSCGKDQCILMTAVIRWGSPPLVRERLSLPVFYINPVRITPARAGKTGSTVDRIHCDEDHPRSCGKDPSHLHHSLPSVGSPPLVRERPM